MSGSQEYKDKLAMSLQEFKQKIMDIPINYVAILDKKFDGVLAHFDIIIQHTDDNGMVDFSWLKEDTLRVSATINDELLAIAPEVAAVFISQHTPNTENYIERLEFYSQEDGGKIGIGIITLELKKLMQRSCRDFMEAYLMTRIESINIEEGVTV